MAYQRTKDGAIILRDVYPMFNAGWDRGRALRKTTDNGDTLKKKAKEKERNFFGARYFPMILRQCNHIYIFYFPVKLRNSFERGKRNPGPSKQQSEFIRLSLFQEKEKKNRSQ